LLTKPGYRRIGRKIGEPIMGESPQDNAGDDKKAEPAAIENHLPVVWSPKLEAADASGEGSSEGDADARSARHSEATNETPKETIAAAPMRSPRFALLAASIALAALFGAFVGSLSASGFAHLWPAGEGHSGTAEAGAPTVKADLAELGALKSNLEGAIRNANGQLAKIAERLDHVERAQIDPTLKIAHIADTVDRLDKRGAAASDITGTIPAAQPSAADAKPSERILQDWIVEDVRRGRALVLNRYGGVFDVSSGSVLPGLGRVETIKREDGEWIVVTARGLITSGR
jgi:hypothetical protein